MLKKILVLVALFFTANAYAGTLDMLDLNHPIITMFEFFGVGLLLAFTPCVFPMVPILSGIIVGNKDLTTAKAFKLSLVFVLSMAVTYALAGAAAGYLGETVQTSLQLPWVIVGFSGVFVLMALSMFGLFELRVPGFLLNMLSRVSDRQASGSYFGVAIMGVLSTLIASPCVTAPLISVLTYISNHGSPVLGAGILFVLALGMGVPLLLFGMGQGALLPKAGMWMNRVKSAFGLMMLGMAVWMLSRVLPVSVIQGLSLTLIIASSAVLLRWVLPLQRTKRYVAVSAIVVGAVFAIAFIFNPADEARENKINQLFTVVRTQSELQTALTAAHNAHKPVILDFYATWCPDCKMLDHDFFANPKVQTLMQSYAAIRVDVSDQESKDIIAIRQSYHVFGTPTVILMDKNGQELKTRLTSAVPVAELQTLTAQAV